MAMSMERSSKSTSGIPQLSSRLPLPQKSLKGPKESTRPPIGSSAHTADRKQAKAQKKGSSTAVIAAPDATSDIEIVDGIIAPNTVSDVSANSDDGKAVPPAPEPTTGQDSRARALSDTAISPPATPKEKRRPRPSLSDRTIETLSQIPPSPVPSRRRSSFFCRDEMSPMRPPLRPASAMSNARSRPSSPIKRPPVPSLPQATKSPSKPTPSKTSTAQPTRPNPAEQSRLSNKGGMKPGKVQVSTRPTSAAPVVTSSPRKVPPSSSASKVTPTKRRLPAAAQTSHPPGTSRQESTTAKSTASNAVALREAIARAKQELVKKKAAMGRPPQREGDGLSTGLAFGTDPSSADLVNNSGLLRSRIKAALSSGHLNVAALNLKSIPEDIKRMYDLREDVGVNSSECVDLTKLIAADNELEILQDIFPDATNAELTDTDGTEYCCLFRGLETLDVHNNLLKELPLGLRRLQQLRTMNLSGNKLGMSSLEIVCQIGTSLLELRLADNDMSGPLSEQVGTLRNLQILDLHGNKITELPPAFQNLEQLKILNLAQNRLSSMPAELFTNSTLVELIVSGNVLSGALFPQSAHSTMQSLKLLDVSHNVLEAFAIQEVALPNLQMVNLSTNRIKALPDISSWSELLTFAIGENQISEIPSGLTTLPKLRNVDLSNNNITKLNVHIGSMANLALINLVGNPLRERKYITMSTDDLKADLQRRVDTTEKDQVVLATTSGSSTILDWSSRSLSDSTLPSLSSNGPIFDIRLHHNTLHSIPATLLSDASISSALKSLDLSHNPLRPAYLSSNLSFPHLHDLSLTFCTLKSLQPLIAHLTAPQLTMLNISTNHLSGPLPRLRVPFPTLTTLLASDNQFTTSSVNAVKGLTTLDIRNNQLDVLEPKLGLLSGNGEGGLKYLEASGNKFRVPRWDVLEKGSEAVLRYLRGRVTEEELQAWQGGVERKEE